MTIQLIGDVHNKIPEYLKIIQNPACEASIQLGDLSFDYSFFKENNINPAKNRWFPGNHDCYDKYLSCPHCMGNYGEFNLGGVRGFFVRGAWSIDQQYRIEGKSWWAKEELTQLEGIHAYKEYAKVKPNLMLSHDCPRSVKELILGVRCTDRTSQLLEFMLNNHRPKLWVFGHLHLSRDITVGRTRFVCLNELETLTL